MKHNQLIAVIGIIFATYSVYAAADDLDSKVKSLVSKMTLEEKVGQMTQLALRMMAPDASGETIEIEDDAKLVDAIVNHHVGSILGVVRQARTVDEWQKLISKIQTIALKKTRLGIPIIYGVDGIHGATFTVGATLFPQPIGMAATWNRELIRKEGQIAASEIKASGIPWNFYPVLEVVRQPLWPRVWETFGEDPYMVSVMGREYIEGHQSAGVVNCLKHYIGYSQPVNGADRTPGEFTERKLREVFLPPFAAGVLAGAPSVMVNSGQIDGIPGHANRHLLIDILRGELGFKGITVSDWADIENLVKRDKVAQTPEEAVRIAVLAGVDMSMVPMDYSFYDILIKLVQNGSVPMSRIDEAVGRILKVKYSLGLFEHPIPNPDLKTMFASAASTQTNLESARESITLLKNHNSILPLKKIVRVLVTGPNANLLSRLNGGWTLTWQGDEEALYPKDKKTILQAIKEKIGANHVVYADSLKAAIRAAKKGIDYAVVCIGEKAYAETSGNLTDLTMDSEQLEFAKKLEDSGIPVVLVLTEGRPRVLHSVIERAQAIVMAYWPGMEGGPAVADVLFGDVNPSGKLPFTYPRAPNALTLYDHTAAEEEFGNFNPEFEFGFGLSYTSFQYSDLKIDHHTLKIGDDLKVSVKVSNVGKVAGKEVVELFVSDLFASVMRPIKQLKGFEKILLSPGESRVVEFTLHPIDFSFIGQDGKRTTEKSPFTVSVGKLVQKFNLVQ